MLAGIKTHLTAALTGAGVPAKDVLHGAANVEAIKSAVAAVIVPVNDKYEMAAYVVKSVLNGGGQREVLKLVRKRRVLVVAHIEARRTVSYPDPAVVVDKLVAGTVARLGAGTHDEDGHWCRLEVLGGEWVMAKGYADDRAAYQLDLAYDGGVYEQTALTPFTGAEVELDHE